MGYIIVMYTRCTGTSEMDHYNCYVHSAVQGHQKLIIMGVMYTRCTGTSEMDYYGIYNYYVRLYCTPLYRFLV